ncbi:serine hydrolase domain-containing protein [Kibdelosporangium phytohabitans]|uniref:Serine hydrolase n=1 Tax=Kibdelosporangium phytohabitans TaxID=860235 RepID=A0A0N9HXF8_9PSEU|nr:serine hydrolase domain-containing protein [Kibdelosporangium phytohabitans]ALG08106.1 serine hydrolase [Kibdelosporangium phytohabitans]MBE1470918.1 CubicO group peptidase (beta-lactamase class C family) [Kibdelosporangium phytohabitans]
MDLRAYVDDGTVPGAVSLVATGDSVEVQEAGIACGTTPMRRDTIFRIASVSKTITAAAVMLLVEDGRIALDDPVGKWLPELYEPTVVRTPESPIDDVVPAKRPITVSDVLTFRAGYGFPADFSLPAADLLIRAAHSGGDFHSQPAPDEWLATLATVPMLGQPGESWLYHTCADIQSVLIARVSGQSLPDFLAERVFEPLGMPDTAFEVPPGKRDRFTTGYSHDLKPADPVDGKWSTVPAFPSGGGGLVSTADDLRKFGQALLGDTLLSRASVGQLTTDHLTAGQRAAGEVFLEGQGWGFGGSVDVAQANPWNVPGRYGWIGGTGTTFHVIPATGTVTVLLTQVFLAGPSPTALMRDFWTSAS